jgi:ubiquitin C-terminal hydrolase
MQAASSSRAVTSISAQPASPGRPARMAAIHSARLRGTTIDENALRAMKASSSASIAAATALEEFESRNTGPAGVTVQAPTMAAPPTGPTTTTGIAEMIAAAVTATATAVAAAVGKPTGTANGSTVVTEATDAAPPKGGRGRKGAKEGALTIAQLVGTGGKGGKGKKANAAAANPSSTATASNGQTNETTPVASGGTPENGSATDAGPLQTGVGDKRVRPTEDWRIAPLRASTSSSSSSAALGAGSTIRVPSLSDREWWEQPTVVAGRTIHKEVAVRHTLGLVKVWKLDEEKDIPWLWERKVLDNGYFGTEAQKERAKIALDKIREKAGKIFACCELIMAQHPEPATLSHKEAKRKHEIWTARLAAMEEALKDHSKAVHLDWYADLLKPKGRIVTESEEMEETLAMQRANQTSGAPVTAVAKLLGDEWMVDTSRISLPADNISVMIAKEGAANIPIAAFRPGEHASFTCKANQSIRVSVTCDSSTGAGRSGTVSHKLVAILPPGEWNAGRRGVLELAIGQKNGGIAGKIVLSIEVSTTGMEVDESIIVGVQDESDPGSTARAETAASSSSSAAPPAASATTTSLVRNDSEKTQGRSSKAGSSSTAGKKKTAGPLLPSVDKWLSAVDLTAIRLWDEPAKAFMRRGPTTGLTNLGNTCYMNGILQCIAQAPALVQHLLRTDHGGQGGHTDVCVVPNDQFCASCCLAGTLDDMHDSATASPYAPSRMAKNVTTLSSTLQQGRVEDAHEFLRCLLYSMIRGELARYSEVKEGSADRRDETTFIHRIFGGYLQNSLSCPSCEYVSKSYESFLDLSLEISNGVTSMAEALKRFSAVETLDANNRWKCPGCKQLVRAHKRLTINEGPPILVAHLKRFATNGKTGASTKLETEVAFAESLDLAPALSETGQEDALYDLFAVLVHKGPELRTGHYFSYVKAANGRWYNMNDQVVRKADWQTTSRQQAYMLFYRRRANASAPSTTGVATSVAGQVPLPISAPVMQEAQAARHKVAAPRPSPQLPPAALQETEDTRLNLAVPAGTRTTESDSAGAAATDGGAASGRKRPRDGDVKRPADRKQRRLEVTADLLQPPTKPPQRVEYDGQTRVQRILDWNSRTARGHGQSLRSRMTRADKTVIRKGLASFLEGFLPTASLSSASSEVFLSISNRILSYLYPEEPSSLPSRAPTVPPSGKFTMTIGMPSIELLKMRMKLTRHPCSTVT